MSFARDVVDAADRSRLALVAIAGDGERREISFGEVADRVQLEAGRVDRRAEPRGAQAALFGLPAAEPGRQLFV